MQVDRIITGDCLEVLKTLEEESVQLVVTSPPYPGQRDNCQLVDDWLLWLDQVVYLLQRVLVEEGVLALNVMFRRQDGWFDGRLLRDVPELLRLNSFHLIDVYIWHKTNPVPAGNLDRHDIPSWEPVFVASCSGNYPFFPVRAYYAEKSVRADGQAKTRENGFGHDYAGGHHELHPAGARQGNVLAVSSSGDQGRPRALGGSFPRALPERFIRQHTKTSDLVLDPFAGVGTTCRVAQELGRRYLGIEINPDEAERARAWLAEPFALPLFS